MIIDQSSMFRGELFLLGSLVSSVCRVAASDSSRGAAQSTASTAEDGGVAGNFDVTDLNNEGNISLFS